MSESFAELFEESLTRSNMKTGQVISAEVLRIDHNFVVVNAGLKSEAFIPVEEFHNDAGEIEVNPGDFVSVAIDALENGYGDTILSRDKAKRLASWMNLEKALEQAEIVTGTVTGKVKGGLTVMVNGIRAFLPGSLVDTRPIKDTSPYEGKTMEFKVIKLDRKRNNVVLSRRAVVEASQGEERAKLMVNLKEGSIVQGLVKNITDYGAFVDLGGIDGLLHITDLAWRRVRHPSEMLTVGQEVTAKILKFDQEKNRVSLGVKQLGDDPWVGIARRYPPNTRLFGKVTNLTDYGAFVEIESGIEGLVHVSEMDWTNKNVAPSKAVALGTEVEVMVWTLMKTSAALALVLSSAKPIHGKSSHVDSRRAISSLAQSSRLPTLAFSLVCLAALMASFTSLTSRGMSQVKKLLRNIRRAMKSKPPYWPLMLRKSVSRLASSNCRVIHSTTTPPLATRAALSLAQ
jgi:small subunit ribosomal protein S1